MGRLFCAALVLTTLASGTWASGTSVEMSIEQGDPFKAGDRSEAKHHRYTAAVRFARGDKQTDVDLRITIPDRYFFEADLPAAGGLELSFLLPTIPGKPRPLGGPKSFKNDVDFAAADFAPGRGPILRILNPSGAPVSCTVSWRRRPRTQDEQAALQQKHMDDYIAAMAKLDRRLDALEARAKSLDERVSDLHKQLGRVATLLERIDRVRTASPGASPSEAR